MAGEALDVSQLPPGPVPFHVPTLAVDLKDEAAIKAMSNAAEASGQEVVAIPLPGATQTPALETVQAQPAPQPVAQPPAPAAPAQAAQPAPVMAPEGTPAKFVNPDGTVDVNKLQASTTQLDAALQNKTLTIEEMVAQYKEKEAQFRNLPKSPDQVAALAQQIAQQQVAQPVPQAPYAPPAMPPMPGYPPPAPIDPNAAYQQLMADFQRDPIGTMYDLARQVAQKETKTLQEFIAQHREQQRDASIRNNLTELAKDDPRVAHPILHNELMAELTRDPGYWTLKNPHEAAWFKVKARLRLGDSQNPTAQPSKTPAPILGGGTPPPVPSMTGQPTPLAINQAIQAAKGKDEMKNLEAQLRDMAIKTGW